MDEWAISIQMLSYKNLMNPSHHISSYVQITFVSSMKNELYIMVWIAHQHHTTSGEIIETKVQNML
jgi:hypothetical protein